MFFKTINVQKKKSINTSAICLVWFIINNLNCVIFASSQIHVCLFVLKLFLNVIVREDDLMLVSFAGEANGDETKDNEAPGRPQQTLKQLAIDTRLDNLSLHA